MDLYYICRILFVGWDKLHNTLFIYFHIFCLDQVLNLLRFGYCTSEYCNFDYISISYAALPKVISF